MPNMPATTVAVKSPHPITPSDLETLHRAREHALQAYAVAAALAESLSATPGIDEKQMALAELAERVAKETFDRIDGLCARFETGAASVPEPIG